MRTGHFVDPTSSADGSYERGFAVLSLPYVEYAFTRCLTEGNHGDEGRAMNLKSPRKTAKRSGTVSISSPASRSCCCVEARKMVSCPTNSSLRPQMSSRSGG
jgi:hypothetical protein